MTTVMENDDTPSETRRFGCFSFQFFRTNPVHENPVVFRQMLLGAPAARGPAPAHAPEAEGEWVKSIEIVEPFNFWISLEKI